MTNPFDIVRGAVSTRDFVPILTHFAVHEGRVHGFDGRVHISAAAPALAGLESFTAPAVPFLAALDACQGLDPTLRVEDGVVRMKGKRFRASIPTGDFAQFPLPKDETGKKRKLSPGLLATLATLRPFVGEAAQQAWSVGVRLENERAVATNNVLIAEVPMKGAWGVCTVPAPAIDELLRIGLDPTAVMVTAATATFYLPEDAWLRTSLITNPWPNFDRVLNACFLDATLGPVPSGLLDAVQAVAPFVHDGKFPVVRLLDGKVSTTGSGLSAEFSGFSGLESGTFHVAPLRMMLQRATHADWSRFPRVPWTGENGIRGVLVGVIQ